MDNQVTILGGGACGLITAYFLAKKKYRVTVVEQTPIPGGILKAAKLSTGLSVDSFYHHIFPSDRALLDLLDELGLQDEVLWGEGPIGIYREKICWPLSSKGGLGGPSFLSLMDNVRFGLLALRAAWAKDLSKFDAVTAEELIKGNVGERAWERLSFPLLKAKFGPLASQTSGAWIAAKLRQRLLCRSRNGTEKLGIMKTSFETFTSTLVQKIDALGGTILNNTKITAFETENQLITACRTQNGTLIPCTKVVSAVSEDELQHILLTTTVDPPWNRSNYVHALCLTIELTRKLSDFYFLMLADPDCPFCILVEHTNHSAARALTNSHFIYLGRYTSNLDELKRPDAEIYGDAIDFLSATFPTFSRESVINYAVHRACCAQPVFPADYLKSKPMTTTKYSNLLRINTAQLFPTTRTISSIVDLAHLLTQQY